MVLSKQHSYAVYIQASDLFFSLFFCSFFGENLLKSQTSRQTEVPNDEMMEFVSKSLGPVI